MTHFFKRFELTFKLAYQQLRTQWQAGDLRVLLLALILAVTAMTAVNFFTNRIAAHLNSQGGLLLGGDLVVIADQPIAANMLETAQKMGLKTTKTVEFPSMVIAKEINQLAEIKALGAGFPLTGDFGVQFNNADVERQVQFGPTAGEVWLEPRLMTLLNTKLQDTITLGESAFKITGILLREPSRGGDMFSFAPRLMMNEIDLPKTQLIQYGSRVKYQLLVAGNADKISRFSSVVLPLLKRGERIEDVKTARPEIKSALDKAETFLSLSAFVSVLLSIVAMLLAAEPFVARAQQSAALMRTFGASSASIGRIMLLQTGIIALVGGIVGCLFGFLVQFALAQVAGNLFLEKLPAPNWQPVVIGLSMSLAMLFAIMWPNIQALKKVPALRILRQDLPSSTAHTFWRYVPLFTVLCLIIFALAKTFKLAMAFIFGIIAIVVIAAALAYLVSKSVHIISISRVKNQILMLGLSSLWRRLPLSMTQMVGFSLGAMALMLLMMIRTDLMQAWQSALPKDAPNRFVINIQPDQVASVQAFNQTIGIKTPQVFPMIRGRLIAKNGQAISADTYDNERAKRLVTREFNLSTAANMQADNKLVQGRWWQKSESNSNLVSIEEEIANNLNIQLNDQLTYDIAGSQIVLKVSSIRKVEWDSMRANFFAVTPLHTLDDFPASYMTAFYLPKHQDNALNLLVQQFPNLTVIDVASVMNQVRDMMQKMTTAVGFVFIFCVLAGIMVLYAALIATRDSRIKESTLLRVLGASRSQAAQIMIIEFACIAFVSAGVAVIVANSLAYYLSLFVMQIPFQFNWQLSVSVFSAALVLIPLAAWLVIRGYLRAAPKQLLNSI